LRVKLAEYYNSDGAEDPIVVELPRGTYVLSFHHRDRAAGPSKSHSVPAAESRWEPATPRLALRNWIIATVLLGALLAASTLVILSLVSNRNPAQAVARDTDGMPPAFRVFWNGFISGPEEPWVIFSNAKFVGRPEIALRYYDSQKDGRDRPIFD